MFHVCLSLSLLSTINEIRLNIPRSNGWIFGIFFTYLTLMFPLALQLFPETALHLYQDDNMRMVLYYNCLHNALLVSISYLVLSLRDTKVLSEEYCDKIGKFLWTIPQIPLCYIAIWRLSSRLKMANIWLGTTSVLTGIIIALQKKQVLVSTLEERRTMRKERAAHNQEGHSRFLGIFLRGLVWDDEHLAFASLDPSPQYAWGMMTGYWILGAVLGALRPFDYFRKLSTQLQQVVAFSWAPSTTISNRAVIVVFSLVMILWTTIAQVDYHRKTNHGNRRLSVFCITVMPAFNGILESFWFFFTFDLGITAVKPYTANAIILFSTGFTTFSIFSALIHAIMWGAHVLPANYDAPRSGGSRTKEQSESLLFQGVIPMSFLWMAWYFWLDDSLWVIACHIYADVWIATSVRLPPPWAAKEGEKNHVE